MIFVHKTLCGGGCRSRSLYMYGGFNEPDKQMCLIVSSMIGKDVGVMKNKMIPTDFLLLNMIRVVESWFKNGTNSVF